jgi:hypothetical protein
LVLLPVAERAAERLAWLEELRVVDEQLQSVEFESYSRWHERRIHSQEFWTQQQRSLPTADANVFLAAARVRDVIIIVAFINHLS